MLPWELAGSSVNLKVRWWTDSRRTSVVHAQARVVEAIKGALDRAGVDMPFPTQVVLLHDQTEEVDGVRGEQREGWPPRRKGPQPRPARQTGNAEGKPGPARPDVRPGQVCGGGVSSARKRTRSAGSSSAPSARVCVSSDRARAGVPNRCGSLVASMANAFWIQIWTST